MPTEDWDAEAARFDEEPDHGLGDPGVRHAWAELMADVVPTAGRMLDVGCGTGSLSVLAAEQGHGVTGIDSSAQMLARAGAKAVRHGVSVDFVRGDAADPPAVGPFDAVLARHVVWALDDPAAALELWVQLVVPGGRLVLIEGRWAAPTDPATHIESGLGGRSGMCAAPTGYALPAAAGLTAAELRTLVTTHVKSVTVRALDDPALWGRTITDERYVLTAST